MNALSIQKNPPSQVWLRLFLLSISILPGITSAAKAAEQGVPHGGVFLQLNGFPQHLITRETVQIDFRNFGTHEHSERYAVVDVIYDIDAETEQDFPTASLLTTDNTKIARLQIESNTLEFTQEIRNEGDIEAEFDTLVDVNTVVNVVNFSLKIPRGHSRLEVSYQVEPRRVPQNRYEVVLHCAQRLVQCPFELRAEPTLGWEISVAQSGPSIARYERIFPKVPVGDFSVAAVQYYNWNIDTNYGNISTVYEFDRRFSVSGWIFLACIAALTTIVPIFHWISGKALHPTKILLLILCLSVAGLIAGIALPYGNNQMRTLRQSDHDQLLMIANSLMRDRIEQELAGESAELSPNTYPLLVALTRQNQLTNSAKIHPIDKPDRKQSSPTSSSILVALKDAPESMVAFEIETASCTVNAIHLSPVPIKVYVDQPISTEDAVGDDRKEQ